MPVQTSSNQKQSPSRTVVPSHIPDDVAKTLRQALHESQMLKGFDWILKKMSEKRPPTYLANKFIKRYEGQILELRGDVLGNHLATFRAALVVKMLQALPRYRMKFADNAYNYLFLEVWLKKKLLAEVLGITLQNVERKIYLSGRKPPHFLDEELSRLLPSTCLKKLK